jgi:CDP-glucose 4,6-dehydratase
MAFLKGFFEGKRVLLTGHTGLKGGWLALWLERLGATVMGVALPPSSPLSLFSSCGLESLVASEVLDIRDAKRLSAVFSGFQPEVVFHLAAQPIVGVSYEDPAATFEVNVMGTINVLQAIRATPSVRTAIMVASDKCYQNVEQIWGYREVDRLGGEDPYSASKACAEIATASFVKSFFHREGSARVASVRAGNVIGGGDWSQYRLVPDCVRALREARPVVLRNPRSVRPWQFVLDSLAGYMLLASRLSGEAALAGPWNFGPPVADARTVKQGADEIASCWGGGRVEIDEATATFHEATLLQLDATKANHGLGWHTSYDFTRAIEATVAWYKAQYTSHDSSMLAFSRGQLVEYESALLAARPRVFG